MDEFKGSKGAWNVGKILSTVDTNAREGFEGKSGHDATEYYGGYLIAESIMKKADAQLIAASRDLLYASQQMVEASLSGDKDRCIDALQNMAVAVQKALGKEI